MAGRRYCATLPNTWGDLLSQVQDGTIVEMWNLAIQDYTEYSLIGGFGWVNGSGTDASGIPLQPGEGFLIPTPQS